MYFRIHFLSKYFVLSVFRSKVVISVLQMPVRNKKSWPKSIETSKNVIQYQAVKLRTPSTFVKSLPRDLVTITLLTNAFVTITTLTMSFQFPQKVKNMVCASDIRVWTGSWFKRKKKQQQQQHKVEWCLSSPTSPPSHLRGRFPPAVGLGSYVRDTLPRLWNCRNRTSNKCRLIPFQWIS